MDYNYDTIEGVKSQVRYLLYADESDENEKSTLKCIQMAQVFKDADVEFQARLANLKQNNWLENKEKCVAMLPWLLKRIDEGYNQEYFYEVLWVYKWIITSIPGFVNISLAKIEELLLDIEKRFLDFGTGPRVIHYLKMQIYEDLGMLELAKEQLKQYKKSRKTSIMDDCSACQPNNLVSFYASIKDYKSLIKQSGPLVNKELTCKTVPNTTYAVTALAHSLEGNLEIAKEHFQKALKLNKFNNSKLGVAGDLLIYAAYHKEYLSGRRLFERQMHFCKKIQPENTRFYFYLGAFLFFKSLSQKHKNVKLTFLGALPDGFPALIEGKGDVLEIYDWLERQVDLLANGLDKRNGNTFYCDEKLYYLERLS